MKIVEMKLADLIPYENNPRHNEKAVDKVKESISQLGFRVPIIVDKKNVIVCGHTRRLAAMKLGMETVPVTIADDLNEEQINALRLAENKSAELATWDDSKLIDEIKKITKINMADFGFDLDFLNNAKTDEPYEDNYEPKIPDTPKAKIGDIYKLGNHRLMCGDCTSESDIKKLTEGKEMDLCVTDPPYNVNVGITDIEDAKARNRRTDGLVVQNDNFDSEESFKTFLEKVYTQMRITLKEGGSFYIFHADSEGLNFRLALQNAGLTLRQNLIWNKNIFVMGRQDYQWKHEPILYGWKDGGAHYFIDDRRQSTVIDEDPIDFEKMTKDQLIEFIKNVQTSVFDEVRPMASKEHPTMKPVKLIARCIKNSSRVGENIIDLFGGSGTTLIASEELKRNCYIIELDPHYVDVIIDRWEKLTGLKAVKIV